jgi:CelD/BcsL family acetyltransferase involved in cellulose biosynthesis
MPEPPDLDIEEIDSLAGLIGISGEWSALWRRVPAATLFQSKEWLIPWWRHLGEGDLWTLVIRNKATARVCGLAPFFVRRSGPDDKRQLLPLGTGISDYLDVLIEPGMEFPASAALFAHLERHRDRWDEFEFSQLRTESPLLYVPAPRTWKCELDASLPCPVFQVPASVEALYRSLPRNMSNNLRRYRNRAGKSGPVTIEQTNVENLEETFEALVRLHQLRWALRGERGAFLEERVKEAHWDVMQGFLALGVLRSYVMRVERKIIAAVYGFADTRERPRFYAYLHGFDPGYGRIAPGTLLLYHAAERFARAGGGIFDFLRGTEDFKYLWGSRDCRTYRRRFQHQETSS